METKNGLLIGWASRDITPEQQVNLIGQFHARFSTGVLDPVTATALCITSGDDALVWVSCDLALVPIEVLVACREKLKQVIPDFPVDMLVMNATHTHTAPDPWGVWYPEVPPEILSPAEYRDFLTDRVVEAVVESWNSRRPGAVSWGYGHAVVGHNRRALFFDDLSQRPEFTDLPGTKTEKNARMYGATNDPQFSGLEGYVDHGVNLLFTFDLEKRLTGAVFNLPCPSQETEGLEQISADFWHETRLELRKRHGDKLFLLPQCAPAGDLSPHPMYNKAAEQRMLKLKNRTSRQEIASRLANSFDEILQWATADLRDTVPLKHAARTVWLVRRLITKDELQTAQEGIAFLETKLAASTAPAKNVPYLERRDILLSRRSRCRRICERYEEQMSQARLPIELHVIRLGDIVFATNPFELFLDFGLRIVGRSPAIQTFLVQLAAGGQPSYLATHRAVQGESYSACLYCNEVSSDGGQELVEETLKTMNELWANA